MKKALTLTLLGGIIGSVAANAQVSLYIAGSTAFRANAYRAITTSFDGGAPAFKNPSTAGTGSSQATYVGTMSNAIPAFGNQTVIIYTDFDGSVRGLADLTAANPTFLGTNGTSTSAHTADITFSDVDKSSTLFPNVPTTETHIAVLPFTYCKNYYTPASVTNITTRQLRELWANGHVALSMFTGSTNDDTNRMYVTGRDEDSGSRVNADDDSFFTGSPIYWGFNTTAPTVWAQLNQNLLQPIYGFGYSSGGNEATALTNQNAGGACVGYLGLSDALTVALDASAASTNLIAPGGGCGIIAYNGVLPFNGYTPGVSTAVPAYPDFTPIKEGLYSQWSYECLEMLNTHTADNQYAYYTNMVAAIDADIAHAEAAGGNSLTYGPVTAIRLSEMRVTKGSVGADISPNVNP
jgi:hypothetical protein